MKELSKNTEMPQCDKTAVISRFNPNFKVVEITETELMGLIFWATTGIEKMKGGSYYSTIEFINNNYNLMSNNKKRYKNLTFLK